MDILILKNCSYCDTERPEFAAVSFMKDSEASVSVLLGTQMIKNEDADEIESHFPDEEEVEIQNIIIDPPKATSGQVLGQETIIPPAFETKDELLALGMDALRVIGDHLDVKDNKKDELVDKILVARGQVESEKDLGDGQDSQNNPFAGG